MPDELPAPLPTLPPQRPSSLIGQLPIIITLLIIAGLLVVWHPWNQTSNSGARTISVTGEADITAEPDEYVFNPEYNFKNGDQATALAAATTKTNDIVAKLKGLGVADNKIKTDSSGYAAYYDDNQQTYYAYLTITVDNKALAQKVQDYLLTTTPYGSVTPQANFSKAKQQQLTDQARNQATADARSKADQSAHNLGFKVGKVKSVSDTPNNYFSGPIAARIDSAAGANQAAPSSPIHQGENDLTYQVNVVYYVR